jgi:hypothetical protein
LKANGFPPILRDANGGGFISPLDSFRDANTVRAALPRVVALGGVSRTNYMKTITTLCALFLGFLTASDLRAEALPYALGLFESGADTFQRNGADYKRGDSGEVSRYQIMPAVWKQYSSTYDYYNPTVAWQIAERILADRVEEFRAKTHRSPSGTELYLLWNKPGHFANAKYSLKRVSRLYLTRAQRFANLYTAVQVSYRDRQQVRQVAWSAGNAKS